MKPIKTLVLVADEARGRLFENHGIGKGLQELEDFTVSVLPQANNEYADKPGRNEADVGGAHHGVADYAATERDQARQAFARALVEEAERRFLAGKYDRFLLIAAPAFLGVLRDVLPATLEKAKVADVDKDFVKLRPEEIVERLADTILF